MHPTRSNDIFNIVDIQFGAKGRIERISFAMSKYSNCQFLLLPSKECIGTYEVDFKHYDMVFKIEVEITASSINDYYPNGLEARLDQLPVFWSSESFEDFSLESALMFGENFKESIEEVRYSMTLVSEFYALPDFAFHDRYSNGEEKTIQASECDIIELEDIDSSQIESVDNAIDFGEGISYSKSNIKSSEFELAFKDFYKIKIRLPVKKKYYTSDSDIAPETDKAFAIVNGCAVMVETIGQAKVLSYLSNSITSGLFNNVIIHDVFPGVAKVERQARMRKERNLVDIVGRKCLYILNNSRQSQVHAIYFEIDSFYELFELVWMKGFKLRIKNQTHVEEKCINKSSHFYEYSLSSGGIVLEYRQRTKASICPPVNDEKVDYCELIISVDMTREEGDFFNIKTWSYWSKERFEQWENEEYLRSQDDWEQSENQFAEEDPYYTWDTHDQINEDPDRFISESEKHYEDLDKKKEREHVILSERAKIISVDNHFDIICKATLILPTKYIIDDDYINFDIPKCYSIHTINFLKASFEESIYVANLKSYFLVLSIGASKAAIERLESQFGKSFTFEANSGDLNLYVSIK